MRRPSAAQWPILVWAVVAWTTVRLQLLAHRRWQSVQLPPPPRGALADTWVVEATLRRLSASCLPRALVLQRWLLARGEPRDVVVGVANQPSFRAHAWLDGASDGEGFHELSRRPALASPQ